MIRKFTDSITDKVFLNDSRLGERCHREFLLHAAIELQQSGAEPLHAVAEPQDEVVEELDEVVEDQLHIRSRRRG